ncbi:polyphosphate kinase [Ereboglobus sp. PH5-10]|uniref:polyphosphate kinase 1 n=1 Tax=Ereboglobus sp. PH5-10 TaxID=2940629 RepID=UPI00240491AD|nr:polyphosphate kinase 1 [Ereboglobus sp. PH5-10]MDF9827476.1 polyphosphate kinase [Ereboglobus sp. PH5-10]
MQTNAQRKNSSRATGQSAAGAAASKRRKRKSTGRKRTTRRGAYFNRELSWLAFNRRVLDQARNAKNPLLERVKFLAIVSSNLDEFFEIRVSGLIQQVESGITEPTADGLSPKEQLRRIHALVAALVEDQYRCWRRELVPALAKNGIVIKTARDLRPAELAWIQAYFYEQVLPVVTPLAIDQAHPFPQLGNKTLNVLVTLAGESSGGESDDNEPRIAILPVPRILPRLVPITLADDESPNYIFLSEIIKLCASSFFPGYEISDTCAFRVTRNSDLYIDDEESDNLLKHIEEQLRNLRRGAAVRLEIEDHAPGFIYRTLCSHLKIAPEYVFRLRGPLNLFRLMSLTAIDRPELKYPSFTPVNCSPLALANPDIPAAGNTRANHADSKNIFEILREQDVMLHHPYDSFAPVVDFVSYAARDPQVFAIKQTLYRTSGDSPIVRALIEASRNGKQVAALVELKARFDEANNIHWARQLEDAGVHVVYGLVGHKTHCKCSLVVRREGDALRRYVHLGTGNYNPNTARLYTDLSLFTARETITADAANLFNTLTGFSRSPAFDRLIVAPFGMHERMQELILREAANAAAGRPARIMAKMNSLVDQETIDNLYTASRAGVKIDLIVRGICCLVPGIRGRSENIRVRSIVGRFLEHARVFYFENNNGGDIDSAPLIYAGSADWMPRNFFRRVEVLYPIDAPAIREWITSRFFPTEMADNENARELRSNGNYTPVAHAPNAALVSAQEKFMADAIARAAGTAPSRSA